MVIIDNDIYSILKNTSNKVNSAKLLAYLAHEDCYRNNSKTPYIYHPAQVVNRINRWGIDKKILMNMVIAAWLHDTLEDTDLDINIIDKLYGSDVTYLVKELTYIKNDKITKADYIENIAKHRDIRVVIIKCADRLCNVEDFINDGLIDYASQYFNKASSIMKRVNTSCRDNHYITDDIKSVFELVQLVKFSL